MGLDQYLQKRNTETIGTWRKHNRLQGWMENLYVSKGGMDEFNCKDLTLTTEDIDNLEKVIKSKSLPKTVGFFFGNDSYGDYTEEEKQYDLQMIADAKQAINDGYEIVYSCWW